MMCTVRTTVINQYYLYLKHVLLNHCFISLSKTGGITFKMTSSLQYTIERNGKILTLLFSIWFVLFIVLLSLLILRLSHINLVVEYTPQKLHMYSPSLYRSNQLKKQCTTTKYRQHYNTHNILAPLQQLQDRLGKENSPSLWTKSFTRHRLTSEHVQNFACSIQLPKQVLQVKYRLPTWFNIFLD